MSILIYMLLAFWQAKRPDPPPKTAPAYRPCATLILRNNGSSNAWRVCNSEELMNVVKQINPDFLSGQSNNTLLPSVVKGGQR